jgi:hypothetical protein
LFGIEGDPVVLVGVDGLHHLQPGAVLRLLQRGWLVVDDPLDPARLQVGEDVRDEVVRPDLNPLRAQVLLGPVLPGRSLLDPDGVARGQVVRALDVGVSVSFTVNDCREL